MSFNVLDALKIYPLSEGKVIAGHMGLNNEIKSISVLEVPQDSSFIIPNQLEISAFYSIANSVEEQLNVLRMLSDKKIAGLILFLVGQIIKEVSPKVIELCNELKLPLIVMPLNRSYTDVIIPIVDKIMEYQNQYLTAAMRIHDQMTSLLLSEKSFHKIAVNLSKIIDRQVIYFDHNDICVANSGKDLDGILLEFIMKQIKKTAYLRPHQSSDILITMPNSDHQLLIAPISSNITHYGIMIVLSAEELSNLDKVAISQTKNALGIMTLNKINLKKYYNVRKTDFIVELIQSAHFNKNNALERAISLDISINDIKAIMLIDIIKINDIHSAKSEEEMYKFKKTLFEEVALDIRSLSPLSHYTQVNDKMVVLYHSTATKATAMDCVYKLGEFLCKKIQLEFGVDARVGIGSYCETVTDIPKSYTQAHKTILLVNKMAIKRNPIFYEDIQLYDLLQCSNLDINKLNETYNHMLAPLIEYDTNHFTQLVKTLQCLIKHNLNTSEVAEIMYLHKNTVLQRRKKIESLYTYDIFKPIWRAQFNLIFLLMDLFS